MMRIGGMEILTHPGYIEGIRGRGKQQITYQMSLYKLVGTK